MTRNYDLYSVAIEINQKTEMNMFCSGFTAALMFVQSVEDFNPECPDTSMLDNDIDVNFFSEESIGTIQSFCEQHEPQIEELSEEYEHEYSDEQLGYYLFLEATGTGCSITDSDDSEFAKAFSERLSGVWAECYTFISGNKDEYKVFVDISG